MLSEDYIPPASSNDALPHYKDSKRSVEKPQIGLAIGTRIQRVLRILEENPFNQIYLKVLCVLYIKIGKVPEVISPLAKIEELDEDFSRILTKNEFLFEREISERLFRNPCDAEALKAKMHITAANLQYLSGVCPENTELVRFLKDRIRQTQRLLNSLGIFAIDHLSSQVLEQESANDDNSSLHSSDTQKTEEMPSSEEYIFEKSDTLNDGIGYWIVRGTDEYAEENFEEALEAFETLEYVLVLEHKKRSGEYQYVCDFMSICELHIKLDTFLAEENFEEALETANEILEIRSNDPIALAKKGEVFQKMGGQDVAAIQSYRSALKSSAVRNKDLFANCELEKGDQRKIQQQNITSSRRASTLYSLAKLLQKKGKDTEAISYYKKLLGMSEILNIQIFEAHMEIGRMQANNQKLSTKEKIRAAERHLLKAAESNFYALEAYLMLSKLYCDDLDSQKALICLGRAKDACTETEISPDLQIQMRNLRARIKRMSA